MQKYLMAERDLKVIENLYLVFTYCFPMLPHFFWKHFCFWHKMIKGSVKCTLVTFLNKEYLDCSIFYDQKIYNRVIENERQFHQFQPVLVCNRIADLLLISKPSVFLKLKRNCKHQTSNLPNLPFLLYQISNVSSLKKNFHRTICMREFSRQWHVILGMLNH